MWQRDVFDDVSEWEGHSKKDTRFISNLSLCSAFTCISWNVTRNGLGEKVITRNCFQIM